MEKGIKGTNCQLLISLFRKTCVATANPYSECENQPVRCCHHAVSCVYNLTQSIAHENSSGAMKACGTVGVISQEQFLEKGRRAQQHLF